MTQPQLLAHELPFWEAFNVLHLSRPNTGFGPGAIPLGELMTYLELMQVPVGEDREEYMQVLRAMDHSYLIWVKEKSRG